MTHRSAHTEFRIVSMLFTSLIDELLHSIALAIALTLELQFPVLVFVEPTEFCFHKVHKLLLGDLPLLLLSISRSSFLASFSPAAMLFVFPSCFRWRSGLRGQQEPLLRLRTVQRR